MGIDEYRTATAGPAGAGNLASAGLVTMQRVRNLGEFGLIAREAERLARRLAASPRVPLSIGDDAAIWQPTPARVAVLTTDTMIEGVHFTWQTTPWRALGWKSLAVNVSDLAAMGAEPRLALLTLGLTGDEEVTAVDTLYDGVADAAEAFDVAIAGGDTVRATQVQVGFTVVGEAGSTPAGPVVLRRDAAQPDDVLAVTGTLGDAAGGLEVLLEAEAPDPADPLVIAHRLPQPRVREARWLLGLGVRCATDNSDGLLREVALLCQASGTHAVVDASALPLSAALRERFGARATALALQGGEEYELVLSVPAARWADIAAAWHERFSLPLTAIGQFSMPTGGPAVRVDGAPVPAEGFDHFQRTAS